MTSPTETLSPKGKATRRALVDAACQVAAKNGVAAVNVMAVCDAAGIGRTSFYNYFTDVPQLLSEIAEDTTKSLASSFEVIRTAKPPGLARLRDCLLHTLMISLEDPDLILLVATLADTHPEAGDLISRVISAEIEDAIAFEKIRLAEEQIRSLADYLGTVVLALMQDFAKGKSGAADVASYVEFMIAATNVPFHDPS